MGRARSALDYAGMHEADPAALVIGVDAGWGGTGWCLATSDGPIDAGRVRLPESDTERRARRAAAVKAWLAGLDVRIAEARMALAVRHGRAPPPRVLIERIPWVYAGRGNQAAIGWGQGRIDGMIELWATRDDWSPCWLVPSGDELARPPRAKRKTPAEMLAELRGHAPPPATKPRERSKTGDGVLWHGWRPWWGFPANVERSRAKAHAIRLVRGLGWGHLLDGHDEQPVDAPPAGDVAEAILIAVGGARHPRFAPDR